MRSAVLTCLIAFATSGLLAAQASRVAVPAADLARLSLDELINQLPHIGTDYGLRGPLPMSAEFRRRLGRGVSLTPEQWKRVLIGTGALAVRERWPASVPFTVSMETPAWLDNELVLEPKDASLHLRSARVGLPKSPRRPCSYTLLGMVKAARHQELGMLSAGKHTLAFDVSFRSNVIDLGDEPRAGTLILDVDVVDTLDQAIPPVSSPALDDAVRRSLQLVVEESDGARQTFLRRDPAAQKWPELHALAVSLAIDVLEEDQLRATILMRAGVDKVRLDVPSDALAARGWSLRVRGVAENVLEDWRVRERWDGELSIALAESLPR